MSRRVVFTGASGGVGQSAIAKLLAAGWEVIGVSRNQPESLRGLDGYSHAQVDLLDGNSLPNFGELPVVSCAAVTRDGRATWIRDANLALTVNALALSSGPVVQISSSSVYDLRKPTLSAVESEATGEYPFLNAYSEGKFAAEQAVVASGRPALMLRPHAVYGPNDSTLVPRLRRAVRGNSIFLPLAAEPIHQFTSVANLANAILLSLQALERDALTSAVALNVTDAEATSVRTAVSHALGEPIRIRTVPTTIALAAARVAEAAAGKSEPRLSEYAVRQLSLNRTYDISAASDLLGLMPTSTEYGY